MGYHEHILKHRKFAVKVLGNSVFITNTRTGYYRQYNIEEFVYGQRCYNEKTDVYPNYVYKEIWLKYKTC